MTAHVSHNAGDNEWYTPSQYIEAARTTMGSIDLDPASSAIANTVVQAIKYHTIEDNGLEHEWHGNIWMNPPYAQPLIKEFIQKLLTELTANHVTQACVLVNNATETKWFQSLLPQASAICLPEKRIRFWHPEKESAPLQGQVILYFGNHSLRFHQSHATFGATATLWRS